MPIVDEVSMQQMFQCYHQNRSHLSSIELYVEFEQVAADVVDDVSHVDLERQTVLEEMYSGSEDEFEANYEAPDEEEGHEGVDVALPLFIDAGLHWCVCTRASGAYALASISTLGVPPKAIGAYALALGCVCTGSRNGLLGFVCDLLVPLTFFSHFRSELCLLKPETLKRTHQGMVRNGKQFKIQ
ncbi:hypothetical protein PIB30_103138 [Stylosanthes scabra]|uniref:Uncharacterized protein n=1 Tax=Stylosanthes scabra TaxID=79078 RepID=A0ABU6VZV0_9FABA|nr:hypothetical protein [Stylosanthes scabra]